MEIRDKISLQILLGIGAILLLSFFTIYISFARFRTEDFYKRLNDKAQSIGQMLVEIDEIDTELLAKIERSNPLRLHNEQVLIFDENGGLIFSSISGEMLKILPEHLDDVSKSNELRMRFDKLELLGINYQGGDEYVIIFVAAEDIFGIRKLTSLRTILILVFFISLILIFGAGRILAGRALNPIRKIISQMDSIGIANLNARVDAGSGKDEIARLAATFNDMLERLEKSFAVQRDFISNASHELKTPLTVITGQLDVILMQDRTNEEYKQTIYSVLEEIRNLNLLSNRLLMLAQASSADTRMTFRGLRIDDLLWQARAELLKRSADCRVNIEFLPVIDDEKYLVINGNELLLKSAMVNILENGCKFSPAHEAFVKISIRSSNLVLDFIDYGPGIPEEEIAKIFQPFYRSPSAAQTRGYGIGLTLVEKIIALHHGTILVKCEEGKGTVFRITLPVSGPA